MVHAPFAIKWRHSEQACVAANHVYVQSGVYEELPGKLAKRTKTLTRVTSWTL